MTLKIDAVDRQEQSVHVWLMARIKHIFMSLCRIMQSSSAFAPVCWKRQELIVRNKTCLDQPCDQLNHLL